MSASESESLFVAGAIYKGKPRWKVAETNPSVCVSEAQEPNLLLHLIEIRDRHDRLRPPRADRTFGVDTVREQVAKPWEIFLLS